MITAKGLKKGIAALFLASALLAPQVSMAASYSDEDIDAQIREQQKKLDELNAQKSNKGNDKLAKQIDDLQAQLKELRNRKDYDAEDAIESLTSQIEDLQDQMAEQNAIKERILEALERLEKLTEQKIQRDDVEPVVSMGAYAGGGGGLALVNPAPAQGGEVSYTQDAKNAQGNSTMVFRYQPNHLYKIYCRTGFITDIALHKGESINFVGGGDTSAWAINSTTVDGVPHVYIKPVVETSTTNIIVTTNKRSYQLIVNTSDWYNPMVRWTYNDEDMIQKTRDEAMVTDRMNAKSVSDLNFDYNVRGNSESKPTMVFDDGEKTIIKYSGKMPKTAPAIFIREHGRKGVSLVNFRVRDNCYILDRVVDQAELRFSDKDVISISRKK